MIKSVINKNINKIDSYPFLGESISKKNRNRVIVFLTAPGKGLVVNSDDSEYLVGSYVDSSKYCFTPFNGSITLSNEVE